MEGGFGGFDNLGFTPGLQSGGFGLRFGFGSWLGGGVGFRGGGGLFGLGFGLGDCLSGDFGGGGFLAFLDPCGFSSRCWSGRRCLLAGMGLAARHFLPGGGDSGMRQLSLAS